MIFKFSSQVLKCVSSPVSSSPLFGRPQVPQVPQVPILLLLLGSECGPRGPSRDGHRRIFC